MNELIKLTPVEINFEEIKAVNARDLWSFLEIKKDFSDWIKAQIESLGLEKEVDYIVIPQKGEQKSGRGGHNKKEYILTLDTAKHIAMASRTSKGRQIRQYFIEVEKAERNRIKSPAEMLVENAKALLAHERRLQAAEKKLRQIETAVDWFTVLGYAAYIGRRVNLRQAQEIGKKASAICNELGIKTGDTPDARFGRVKTYPADVLDEVFNKEEV